MPTRLRVLHVLHHIVHYPCGYRTRSLQILQSQRDQGLDTFAVSSSDHENGNQLPDPDSFDIRRTPTVRRGLPTGFREWRLMSALRRTVRTAIAEIEPDIVHAHSPVLVALPALLAARRHQRPFVYEVRDLWENASVDLGKFTETSCRYRVARAADTYVLRRAEAVTVICDSMRQEIATRLKNPDGAFVAANGFDVTGLQCEPAPGGARPWNLPDHDVLGFIGTLQPYEGLDLLIDAMPEILRRRPGVHLLIVGDGNHEASLRAQVSAKGLGKHVTFTGRLDRELVGQAYAACDLLVYPRRLTATTRLTTPLKPLEAMALGKTVIASDVPALQELVRPGETGVLFAAGDTADLVVKVVHALQSTPFRERVGEAARDWVKRERQWCTVVAAYHEAYQAARDAFERRRPAAFVRATT